MDKLIKDTAFKLVANSVKPDSKKRIVLSRIGIAEGVMYHIYRNSFGQIVLDPQVSVPAYEAWLFNNEEALSSVRQGLLESALDRTMSRGSFAEYNDDES